MRFYMFAKEDPDRLWLTVRVESLDKEQAVGDILEDRSVHDSEADSYFAVPSAVGQYIFSEVELSHNWWVPFLLL